MTPLAAQGLVCWSGWWTATSIAVIDVVFHVLVELFKKKGALEAHLLDPAIQTGYPQARAVIVVLDIGYSATQFNAFPVVGGFDGWRQVFRSDCAGC